MKYPRLKRELKKGAKLTDAQAVRIVEQWKAGATKSALARQYGVTVQAIFYICLDPEERASRVALYNQRKKSAPYNAPDKRAAAARQVRAKKYRLFKDYRRYEREQAYATKHHGKPRPKQLDSMSLTEKQYLAGIAGGAATKRKGRQYYQSIVNRRWNNPNLPIYTPPSEGEGN